MSYGQRWLEEDEKHLPREASPAPGTEKDCEKASGATLSVESATAEVPTKQPEPSKPLTARESVLALPFGCVMMRGNGIT